MLFKKNWQFEINISILRLADSSSKIGSQMHSRYNLFEDSPREMHFKINLRKYKKNPTGSAPKIIADMEKPCHLSGNQAVCFMGGKPSLQSTLSPDNNSLRT